LNDWRFFLQGVFTSANYVVAGFEVTDYANIFLVPGFTVKLSDVALLFPEATTQAAGFYVSSGQEADAVVSLSASATNYVEASLSTVLGTPDIRAFWDQGANGGAGGEFTETIDTVINLTLNVTSNVSGFTPGLLPLYKVATNSSGVATALTDCRPMFFRLGTGGNTPNPANNYAWPNLPSPAQSRQENAVTSTLATPTNAPFEGADKNLLTLKNWMDAMMSMVKEIKGTPYWYSPAGGGGGGSPLINAVQNGALAVVFGGVWTALGVQATVTGATSTTVTVGPDNEFAAGPASFTDGVNTFSYTSYAPLTGVFSGVVPNPLTSVPPVTIGDEITQGPVGHLELEPGSTIYRLGRQHNATLNGFADIDLTTYPALYVLLPNQDEPASYGFGNDGINPVNPKSVTAVTPTSITVNLGGNYAAGGGIVLCNDVQFAYTAYSPGTGLFSGVTPDPTAIINPIASPPTLAYPYVSGGVGYYIVSSVPNVPGQNGSLSTGAEQVYWLALYDGAVTIKTHDSDLAVGESIAVGGNTAANILKYIGSPNAGATEPQYTSDNYVTPYTNLTNAISELDAQAGVFDLQINEDRNLKLVRGGTWGWDLSTNTLSWSANANVQVPGLPEARNNILAGSVVLAADGAIAWVEINRTGSASTNLTVNVGTISTVAEDDNTVIIARRTGNQVIVGSHSFAMRDREATNLDGALGVIDDYFSEVRMQQAKPASTRLLITDSDVLMLTGETRSQRISSFLLDFGGAQLDFQNGNVYQADGVTAFPPNFTPVIPAAGMWRWFAIAIIPAMVGADDRMSGTMLVLPAPADGATMAAAPRAVFAGTGISLGQVAIFSADGTTVSAISQANIVQLGVGSGSGNGGGINKVTLYDGVDTALPTVTPGVIDGVTVATGMTVVGTQLLSGNNRVYQAAVTPGASSPTLPQPIVMGISNANPYAGGNMESVVNAGNVATPQAANDAYFKVDGTSGVGGTPAIAGDYWGVPGFNNNLIGPTYFIEQPFVAGSTGNAGTASLFLAGSDPFHLTGGYLNVSIQTDSGGLPSGTNVTNVVQVLATSLPFATTTPYNPSPVTVAFSSGTLTSGQTYHLVVDASNVVFGSGFVLVFQDYNFITNAVANISSNSGSTWTPIQDSGNNANLLFAVTTGSGLISSSAPGCFNNTHTTYYQATATTTQVAQPFTPATSETLTALLYELGSLNSYTGSYTLSIFTDNAGQPGTLVPGATVSVAGSTINSSNVTQWQLASLTAALTGGTQYWFVIDFTNIVGLGGLHYIAVGMGEVPATSPPEFSLSTDSGSTWTPQTNQGLVFAALNSGSSPVVFAQNLSTNTTESETLNTVSLGQTFTAGFTAFLDDVQFQLSIATLSPPPSGNLYVKVYTDSAGQPGTLIETSAPLNSATLTTTPTVYTFTFGGTNTLTSGQVYHAVLDDSGLAGTTTPGSIAWTAQPDFASPYDPAGGDLLVVQQGTQFHDQLTEFNGTTWLVNRTFRYFNGVDFMEQAAPVTSTLLNNTTANVFSVTALGSENIVVEFSILRNGVKEMGTAWLVNDGATAQVSSGGSYTGATGLTFSASLSGGNVNLIYTLDNSGTNATLKYMTRRWSDGTAGPTGTPSYAPVLPGAGASAFVMSDNSGTPNNCMPTFNVLGKTRVQLNFTYTVGAFAGTVRGALVPYVNGQRVPRYIAGVTLDQYYNEISNNTLEFSSNLQVSPLSIEIEEAS
jgi:hypothetical protein